MSYGQSFILKIVVNETKPGPQPPIRILVSPVCKPSLRVEKAYIRAYIRRRNHNGINADLEILTRNPSSINKSAVLLKTGTSPVKPANLEP